MFLEYQGNKHRLMQTGDSTFEFRNPALASKFVNTEVDDPLLHLVTSLFTITDSNTYPENPEKTDRNLVYFTANSDESYLRMLRVCLRSITSHASTLENIDFMVIMDSFWEFTALRNEFPEINLHFRQVKKPVDGVKASMNKLSIFELHPYATEYQKILYLDCDIVFNQDIQRIFAVEIEDSKIYSAIHSECHQTTVNTEHHNLTKFNREMVECLRRSGITAFNAGQFLMLGTAKMARHFQNISLIRDLWQGDFFFEQSFMNTYFNCNFASDTKILTEFFTIYYIGDSHMSTLVLDKTKNVHYAGSPCDGSMKLGWVRKEFGDLLSD